MTIVVFNLRCTSVPCGKYRFVPFSPGGEGNGSLVGIFPMKARDGESCSCRGVGILSVIVGCDDAEWCVDMFDRCIYSCALHVFRFGFRRILVCPWRMCVAGRVLPFSRACSPGMHDFKEGEGGGVVKYVEVYACSERSQTCLIGV